MQVEMKKVENISGLARVGYDKSRTSTICARNIADDSLISAYKLRHKVFAEELGWVQTEEHGLEYDSYDDYAKHFGVFNELKILAYLRLVVPEYRYMLEKEFSNLVSTHHHLRKENDTREVSRLCVSEDERSTKIQTPIGQMGVSMLLYRCVYQWCVDNNVRYLYLVVEHKVFRLLKMLGFPCELIGEPTKMPDGVVAVAAMMDWRNFEDRNFATHPDLMDWFSQYQSSQDVLPLQQPGGGLRLGVFS